MPVFPTRAAACLAALLLLAAVPAAAQPAPPDTAASAVHEVPFASEGNRIALTVANVTGNAGSGEGARLPAATVRLTGAPAWLRFSGRTAAVAALAPGAEARARFRFDAAEDAPAGREATLTFAVEDAESGALLTEKRLRVKLAAPEAFALRGNYPNPFRSQTKIAYALPEAADVTVEVYDALGRRVERRQQAGRLVLAR